MSAAEKRAHPLLWVPTLYFAMGTPMIAVSTVAAIMYKNLGVPIEKITVYTGLMYLPWVIKPLWAPVVELHRTKKFFVLMMEALMAASFVVLAFALRTPAWVALSIGFFWLIGFSSATQDIAGDGVFIGATTAREQALYVGIQGVFWNLGRLLASGALVSFTGYLHKDRGLDWFHAWSIVMLIFATILVLAFVWHYFVLPPGDRAPSTAKLSDAFRVLGDAWVSFFRKPQMLMMVVAVFFYRFGEGFIEKLGPIFMMDSRAVGGLGLDNMVLGHINGTVGTIGFFAGTLLGGLFAARYGLRRTFVPLAFALNVPHITFFLLSQTLPTNVWLIGTIVTIEKIGYGFGTVGMMLYMMQQLAPGKYRTAHYAFATGIMALCMMLTGLVSGHIQKAVGYKMFFIFVLLASIPPVIIAALAPFRQHPEGEDAGSPQEGSKLLH